MPPITRRERASIDYVRCGNDDGKPLGLVEAKRTKKDARIGQRQAELYADCLEARFGQRPVIFYTNGYEHWIWDAPRYPPRPIQGFLTKDELGVARSWAARSTIRPLSIAGDRSHDRRALLPDPRHPPCRRDL